jgi:cytochrome oxidase assembly protein ShyY1
MTERRGLIMLAMMVFSVSLATWIVSRLEKRTLDEYGLSRQRRVVVGCN